MVVIKVLQERIYYISTFFSQKTIKDCKLYFNFDKTRKKMVILWKKRVVHKYMINIAPKGGR